MKDMLGSTCADEYKNDKQTKINKAISEILSALGEDISRPGLVDTPKRVAKSLIDLTCGQHMSPSDIVNNAIFPYKGDGMVLQKGIEFFSLCEHHLLPFFGKVYLAYMPNKNIIGLSKIGRIIDIFAKRLQVQENLTHQIASAIDNLLAPKGTAVLVEASHFCMMMRGVKKQGGSTMTSAFTGVFESNHVLRSDFLHAIKN
jgi:GTP cyclohydrolase I